MRNLSMFVLLISSCLLHAAAQATRIVKLRYEIVPGFSSTALLYEPEHMTGKMPAILNVNDHGAGGKAVEHKQKRCINQARRGILALSLEWIGMGELSSPDNEHNQIGLLDLAGANGVGLFYLAMRRGPDYLYDDPRVDRTRIGVTGLSGGGWQTMLLSTLDTRVGPAVPVAGFSSLTTPSNTRIMPATRSRMALTCAQSPTTRN